MFPLIVLQVLKKLSCSALKHRIYTVINLIEADSDFHNNEPKNKNEFVYYNTQVVFDRNGAIIAR